MAHLVATSLQGEKLAATTIKSLLDDPSEIEKALRKRMKSTMEAATRVLEAMEDGGGGGGGGGGGDAVSPEGTTPRSAGTESRLMAMKNLLKADNATLRDREKINVQRIEDLEKRVAGTLWFFFNCYW